MEKIFTIGNNPILKQLGFELIEMPSLTDTEMHDWVVRTFSTLDFDKLIIDLSGDSVKAIKIVFHIRLSLKELLSKVLKPILLISPLSLHQIIINCGTWSQIFATKGLFFSSYEKAKVEISEIIGLKYGEYKTHFLNIINVRPDETEGRHSLANQWGAYTMDKAANINSSANNTILTQAQHLLYFKFVAAHNFEIKLLDPTMVHNKDRQIIQIGNPDKIAAQNKRILLIDDEADKGWETVLRAAFKTSASSDFTVIGRKIKDFESLTQDEKDLIVNGNFDLFLVDLRLNGLEEEDISNPRNFSGTKILNKIKELNKGNQVIMFTASNKAWNMKSLLDLGANGYYIKETPEYNFSLKFSEENYRNFKNEVGACFENSYLKEVDKLIEAIQNHKPNFQRIYSSDDKSQLINDQLNEKKHWVEITKTLDNVFLNLNSDLPERFNLSMLLLFRNFELLTEWFYQNSDPISFKSGELKKLLLEDKTAKKYNEESVNLDNVHIHNSTGNKVQAILYQKLNITDYDKLRAIQRFTTFRNNYLHPEEDRHNLKKIKAEDIVEWLRIQKEIFTTI